MSDGEFCCKLGRIKGEYDLSGLDDLLKQEREAGATLDDLTNIVNKALVRYEIKSSTEEAVSQLTVDEVHKALVGDDVSSKELEIRDTLRKSEVPLTQLRGDMISYETTRKHLGSCLGIDTGRHLTLESGRRTIQWSDTRHRSVVEGTFQGLQRIGEVDIGEHELIIESPRVHCEDCGTTYDILELVDKGGCQCQENPSFVSNSH